MAVAKVPSGCLYEICSRIAQVMDDYDIDSHEQRAMFISQLAHETGGFKWFEELASGEDYEGRRDLGNEMPGDGKRYKGRGAIQLTGRTNYRLAGYEDCPEIVSRPEHAFIVAGWYWTRKKLNDPAGRGDIRRVTKLINGGYNGLANRQNLYEQALKAFKA
jgi:putative chitinase